MMAFYLWATVIKFMFFNLTIKAKATWWSTRYMSARIVYLTLGVISYYSMRGTCKWWWPVEIRSIVVIHDTRQSYNNGPLYQLWLIFNLFFVSFSRGSKTISVTGNFNIPVYVILTHFKRMILRKKLFALRHLRTVMTTVIVPQLKSIMSKRQL